MFESVLVANRGEIARRIIRTCRRLGARPLGVHSDADTASLHVAECDDSVLLGGPRPADSYLARQKIIDAARQLGAEAIHPGYGFLSEDAAFAHDVIEAGLVWIGPAPDVIESMGDKIGARNLMRDAGVPVAAGTVTPLLDLESALRAATELGYPLMVKGAAGGGGIGMGVAVDEESLRRAFSTAQQAAARYFGTPSILLERYVEHARHVEVQVLGQSSGRALALGERDCSVQRRHQKVIEETPSPGLDAGLRERLFAAAVRAAEAVDYRGAGTVEFLVDAAAQEFVFLEMNTRLQVEHPITELVYGVDLVEQQFRVADGQSINFDPNQGPRGHALELRIYAEDPVRFLPSPGPITRWEEPHGPGIRVDGAYRAGDVVSPYYDPLLAKLCVWAANRDEALERARAAVAEFSIEGPKVNLPFLAEVLDSREFASGSYSTDLVADLRRK